MKMFGRNFGYLKMNRQSKEKIVILSVLLIGFLLAPFLNNFNIYNNLNEDNQKNEEFPINYFKTQDLAVDDSYEDTGAPWKVSHWANRTDYNLPVSFGNGSSDTEYMDLGSGWEGYQLNATINDLYDERNWVNGTFHGGTDDGNPGTTDDDSNDVLNWTFGEYDVSGDNEMSGNYFDGVGDVDGDITEDCVELRMWGRTAGNDEWDQNDACWWSSIFNIPRGDVIEGKINLAVYPHTYSGYSDAFSLQIYLNNVFIYGIGLYSLSILAGGATWVDIELPLNNWLDDPSVFPDPIDSTSMNITTQLKRVSSSIVTDVYGTNQRLFVDNVSLIVKAEAKPEQIGLKMNNQPISNIDWGNGAVTQVNTWITTSIAVKFNSTEVTPPEMGGYDVEFKTDLNLFAKKMNKASHYQPNFYGTSFKVSNDSSVEWESYARVSVPTGYKETNMTIEFPEDVQITWISNAENPNTNILQYCDNSTLGLLEVFNFSETPDGFWWIKGESPNYCTELNIYNGPAAIGPWVLDNTFLSGDYINITGKIESSSLDISGYIENTKAKLHIRFPNGTIWTAKNQIKQVNDIGMAYFDPFQIPNSDTPDYEVGDYQAIITWNNSYSNFNLQFFIDS